MEMEQDEKWQPISVKAEHNGPVVYQIRLVDEQGHVVQIGRLIKKDPDGILLIGMATEMNRRRKDFINGFKNHKRHSEGKLLYLLLKYSSFKTDYRGYQYEYYFQPVSTKGDAEQTEMKLIKKYVKIYGEAPPLNSVIPKRDNEKGWKNNRGN